MGLRVSNVGLNHLKDLKNLEVLSLNGTQIDDFGLASLRAATHLRQLSLAGTDCTFSGVAHFFVELQHRSLDEALEATLPIQRNEVGAVTSLDLASLRTTDAAASYLKGLDHLEWLSLNGSDVSDEILRQIADLPRLTLLNLNNTSISDKGLAYLAKSRQLQTLHLANTHVTEAGVTRLKHSLGGRLRVYLVDLSRDGHSAVPGALRAAVPK